MIMSIMMKKEKKAKDKAKETLDVFKMLFIRLLINSCYYIIQKC
jgi:hypothetical protein